MLTLERLVVAATLGVAFTLSAGAQAADLGGRISDDRKWEGERSYGDQWGPGWVVRGRALYVAPDEASKNWQGLAAGPHGLSITDSIVPEADISYFFNRHLAAEVILGVTPHTIKGAGDLAGGGDIGDVWLLPATALLQYHFDSIGGVKPYVGAGVNYTVFFGEDAKNGYSNLSVDNHFGWALQAGLDIPIDNHWFLNVDVKKIFLDTTAHVDAGANTHVAVDTQIDPWVVGVGVGYRFGGGYAPLK
jgi:outer membrane protein